MAGRPRGLMVITAIREQGLSPTEQRIKEKNMTSLVIAEHDNASLKGATLNTISAAAACGGEVHVLVAGHNAAAAAQAASQIAGVAKVIHADSEALAHGLAENVAAQVLACLLYTSPSPRDGATSRMPSSA